MFLKRASLTRVSRESIFASATLEASFSRSRGRQNDAKAGEAVKHSLRDAVSCSLVTT